MNCASLKYQLQQLNWLIVIFTLLVFLLLIKLGFWQVDRALEKEQRQERISELSQRQALSLEQVLALNGMQDGINDLPIQLSGIFNGDKVFLLDNQPNKGRLGTVYTKLLRMKVMRCWSI